MLYEHNIIMHYIMITGDLTQIRCLTKYIVEYSIAALGCVLK